MTNVAKPVSYSQSWTFFEGDWHEGNVPIMGPRTHAAWLGSAVFDGNARGQQLAGVGVALVAQRIEFGGMDDRRRQAR